MSSPYERLNRCCENADENGIIRVRKKDLLIALRFLKYHRQWRLYDGSIAARKIAPDAKLAKRIDRRRVKYYVKLYGVDIKDIVERVTKYMRDAIHGGGSHDEAANIIEAYLHPEKYVQSVQSTRKKSKVRELQTKKQRGRRRRKQRSH